MDVPEEAQPAPGMRTIAAATPHSHPPREADWQRETPEPATSLNRLTQTAAPEPGRSTVQQDPSGQLRVA